MVPARVATPRLFPPRFSSQTVQCFRQWLAGAVAPVAWSTAAAAVAAAQASFLSPGLDGSMQLQAAVAAAISLLVAAPGLTEERPKPAVTTVRRLLVALVVLKPLVALQATTAYTITTSTLNQVMIGRVGQAAIILVLSMSMVAAAGMPAALAVTS